MAIDMPPKEPHSNQVASTPITVLSRRNDTDLIASSAATAEIDNILLVGGEVVSSSTAADAPAETASAIGRALKALTETFLLAAQQNNDPLLKQIIMSWVEKKTCPGHDRYLIDERNLVWYTPNDSKPVLAVPRSMVPELLALVHTLHGHAGGGATPALVRSHFHWPTIVRDTRLYVASCGCNRQKRSRSQKIATMTGRAVEPWETLEVDILSMGTTSRTGNKHILLVVDRASRFPFAVPLPSKGTKKVARILANLCLAFGVPRNIRSDGGGEFRSEILKSLCHWLKARLDFGPADNSRGQGAVERFGGWLQEMLAELCRAWPGRWDEYVAPACWIKRTLPDSSLQSKMTAFELMFGRKPRTSLDSLVPLLDGAAQTTSLDKFVEKRKQNLGSPQGPGTKTSHTNSRSQTR